jgi:hypothetical protein
LFKGGDDEFLTDFVRTNFVSQLNEIVSLDVASQKRDVKLPRYRIRSVGFPLVIVNLFFSFCNGLLQGFLCELTKQILLSISWTQPVRSFHCRNLQFILSVFYGMKCNFYILFLSLTDCSLVAV